MPSADHGLCHNHSRRHDHQSFHFGKSIANAHKKQYPISVLIRSYYGTIFTYYFCAASSPRRFPTLAWNVKISVSVTLFSRHFLPSTVERKQGFLRSPVSTISSKALRISSFTYVAAGWPSCSIISLVLVLCVFAVCLLLASYCTYKMADTKLRRRICLHKIQTK